MHPFLPSWSRRVTMMVCGLLLFAGGYVTALWKPWATIPRHVQAAESTPPPQQHQHGAHDHAADSDVDLGPFMLRNAYHLSTLYHAARAARWELAAHELEELQENLSKAAEEAPPYAASFKSYQQDVLPLLQGAVTARDAAKFHTAFRTAVEGCNDCHKTTKHPFIVIPYDPPSLSIFVLPPSSN